MLKDIGVPELLIILLIVVMVFGVGKLPQVAGQLGKSLRAFKQSSSEPDEEEEATAPKRRVVKKAAAKKPAAEEE